MDNFTFLNLLTGPLGYSFGIIKDREHLFSEKDFQELPPETLKRFNKLSPKKEKKMFLIGIAEEENALEVVNELEKLSLIQASETIKKFVKEMDSDLNDEKAIIDKFASQFDFLTNIKTKPITYR